MYFTQIESIEYAGEEQTYDLIVPDYHNFILANGIVTHNSGKTTLSQAAMYYLDPTICLDRIVFDGQDLMKQIDIAEKGQGIIFDEAVMSLASQDFATDLQKALIKKFTLIRSKNLYIMLIIPNFFLMRKWFSIDRTKFMLYTYSPDGISRGYFRFFSWNRKKELYLKGFKFMNVNAVAPNFRGRFTDTEGFFIDPDAYEAKKQAAIKRLTDTDKSDKTKLQESYQDKVLKLNIDNKQWKEKLKEKYLTKYTVWNQKFRELKKKQAGELAEIKRQSIDLEKSKDKEKIVYLEREYARLLYNYYNKMDGIYRKETGDELKLNAFLQSLLQEAVSEMAQKELKNLYEVGKQINRIIA